MTWTAAMIARAIALQTLNRRCVLLVDRCLWTGYECDVLGVTVDLRIIDIEIKISRADLKADAEKDKWWHRQFGHWSPVQQRYVEPDPVPRAWPPKVWKHYYAMPADIWKPELMDCLPSPNSGVLLMRRQDRGAPVVATCARRAKPNRDAERLTPQQAIDIARLANLRMFDAYEKLRQHREAA
jgi:hypothetical protein